MFDIVLGSDDVVLGSDDVVLTEDTGVTASEAAIKLVTLYPKVGTTNYGLTFSEFRDRGFRDWATESSDDGADFTSELLTGYSLFGDAARDKQIQFWSTHFERTERNYVEESGDLVFDFPSKATCRVRFDFTSSTNANRWSDTFEGYRLLVPYTPTGAGAFDYGYDVITTKNRVRGHGKAVQFSITSQAGKDIRLLGWDVRVTGRTRP
jgi:hypothetical protein